MRGPSGSPVPPPPKRCSPGHEIFGALPCGLLAVTVALAALLAFEAQRATRSHRVTAERALRDYASVAAWEFLSASNELLDRNLADRFGRVLRARQPHRMTPSSSGRARRRAGRVAPVSLGGLQPNSVRGGLQEWLAGHERGAPLRSVACLAARRDPRPNRRLRPAVGGQSRGGVGERRWGRIGSGLWGEMGAVHWLRTARAPLAAYGIVTCPDAFASLFAEVHAQSSPPAGGGHWRDRELPTGLPSGVDPRRASAVSCRTDDDGRRLCR